MFCLTLYASDCCRTRWIFNIQSGRLTCTETRPFILRGFPLRGKIIQLGDIIHPPFVYDNLHTRTNAHKCRTRRHCSPTLNEGGVKGGGGGVMRTPSLLHQSCSALYQLKPKRPEMLIYNKTQFWRLRKVLLPKLWWCKHLSGRMSLWALLFEEDCVLVSGLAKSLLTFKMHQFKHS